MSSCLHLLVLVPFYTHKRPTNILTMRDLSSDARRYARELPAARRALKAWNATCKGRLSRWCRSVITWPFCLPRGDPSLRPLEGTRRRASYLAYSPATSHIVMSYLLFHCCSFWGPCLDVRSPIRGIVIVGVVPPSSDNREGFPTGVFSLS
jgi:hypothetical protein